MKTRYRVHVLMIWAWIAIFGFTSCDHCKRITRNHPECFRAVTIRDTVKIPEVHSDTVFSATHSKDTVVLQKDRLTVKYYQSNDTVFLSGTCRDSTIIREVPALCPEVLEDEGLDWWIWLIIGWVSCMITGLIIFLRK